MEKSVSTVEGRAGELLAIPLSMLVPSVHINVRRTGGLTIDELAASIDAQGLLQNLIVVPQGGASKKAPARYAVAAGGRRLRALMALAKAKKIAKDEAILCKVAATEEDAKLASLAENSGREALHPADEFDAMNEMIVGGRSVEDVAARFGLSVLTVQRRMKLARVAPELIAAYRRDELNLEQLMALAVSDDHEAQVRVWGGANVWQRAPASLRAALLGHEIEIDARRDPVVTFVTLEAYEQAGGTVRRDLFSDEDGGACYLSDAELLRRLAHEKLQEYVVPVVAEGWAWVDTRVGMGYDTLRDFAHASKVMREPTKAQQGKLDKLKAQLSAIEQRMGEIEVDDAADNAEAEKLEAQADKLSAEAGAIEEKIAALRDSLTEWSPEVKSIAGAVVGLNRKGEIVVHRGLVRAEDRKRAAVLPAGSIGGGAPVKGERAKPLHSEGLMRSLTAQKTVALQMALAGSVPVALVALTHTLVQPLVLDRAYGRVDVGLEISAKPQFSALSAAGGAEIEAARAWHELRALVAAWVDRLPQDSDSLFAALLALPQPDLLELLGLCSALSLSAIQGTAGRCAADTLAQACGLDMAQWWKPTAATYFNAVSKARILEVLAGAEPPISLKVGEAMKKGDLVSFAERTMVDSGWLPEPLRQPAPVAA